MNVGKYQPPPVSRRGYLWRILVAAAISLTVFIADSSDASTVMLIVDLVAAAICWPLVFWRRRRPAAVALIIGLLAAVSPLSTGPALWAGFSLATTRRWSQYVLVAGACLAASFAYAPIHDPHVFDDIRFRDANGKLLSYWPITLLVVVLLILVVVGLMVLIAAWGGQVGARRELLWTLRDRAERAEAERDLRVAQARSLERERIAREMHDGLAHRISQISMHAGALAFRDGLSATELHQSMEIIQQASHQAMIELRDVLGVLRDTDGGDGTRPLPTSADVAELITFNRAAGMEVIDQIDPMISERLPDQLGRAVYRIVQEGLTNASRHAPGAPVSVTIEGAVGEQVTVTISNPLRIVGSSLPDSGFGLIGLQERVALLGGTLQSGSRFDRYQLQVRLPWSA
ncbi:hypothetical protein FOE78_03515 [Microlunatus elymi]|uniref:histidine kinase n=1 Tax=Microlunatus elymi TaxID=2596828 RepID=A0A516PV96_9ACTN|nr:histidine kinase [Microlunatus elymi]QDP95106.1 hypothetical protein FOE78_03515 [Microlunatus elymi]